MTGGRNRTLGNDAVKLSVSLPQDVYEALVALAALDYEANGTMARRLIVEGLRQRNLLPGGAS